MLERLSTALNIHPGEGQLVVLLLIHSFFIGIAKTFTSTTASALFIDKFGAQMLPYVYIGIAIVVSLIGYGYTKLKERVSFKALTISSLLFLILSLIIFWLLLGFTTNSWPVMILMIWFELLMVLTGLEFWGLSSLLLDLRQGKRLFGLIGSGDMAASIISGFAMSYIVSLVGTINLLLIAVAGVAGSLLLLVYTIHLYKEQLAIVGSDKKDVKKENKQAKQEISYLYLFKNRYTRLVFALAAIATIGFFFVDNAFYDMIETRYENADQLAAFIGNFLAFANIASLIGRIFISAPFISRYGLLGGMLSLPVLVSVGVLLVIILGTVTGSIAIIFWLTTMTKLFDSSIRFSIYNSSELILYQPLPAEQGNRVLTIVESFAGPLTGGISGLLLLFLMNTLSFGAVQLYYILTIILIIWFVISVMLNREYTIVLINAITKRSLEGDFLALTDGASLAVLEQGIKSAHSGQVIYSLNVMEKVEHEQLDSFLIKALRHEDSEVRREALNRIERRGNVSAIRAVRLATKFELLPQVRAAAICTLSALGGEDIIEEVEPFLEDPNPQIRQGAMVGLLRSGGIEGVLIAGSHLLELVHSDKTTDRLFAAQILGEVGISGFYRPLVALLQDKEIAVQQAAILAAGKLKSAKLWPIVVELLAMPSLSTASSSALIAGGEMVVPELQTAFTRYNEIPSTLIRLARICGRIKGEQVTQLLQNKLDTPNNKVRLQLFKALSRCDYQAGIKEEINLIHEIIKLELADSAWILAVMVDIGNDNIVKQLNSALHNELEDNKERIFLLLSFIYDSVSILNARDTLNMRHVSAEKIAYALEIIDIMVSGELKQVLLPLFDKAIPPNKRLEKLTPSFPQDSLNQNKRLINIVEQTDNHCNSWVKACALDIITKQSIKEAVPVVVKALSAPTPLIRETAIWALLKLDRDSLQQHIKRLANDPSTQVARVGGYLRQQQIVVENGDKQMLSTIEKVFILKSADIFAETPDDALAEVASILEEVEIKDKEVIFEKGEPGSCMYIIFDGTIRIHNEEQTVSDLESGDIFGEMALLDSEPRLASATALTDTMLLRLDQEPFYELMTDRSEVARGIIKVLSQRLRELSKRKTIPEKNPKKKQRSQQKDVLMKGILDKL